MPRAMIKVWAAFALGVMTAGSGAAQQPPAEPPKHVSFRDVPAVAKRCDSCHFYSREPLEEPDGRKKYWVGPHYRWDLDPHRRASEVLDGPLGKQMKNLLAASDPENWKKEFRADQRCASCHGGTRPDIPSSDNKAGLSCYDCHQQPRFGAQTDPNYDWVANHQSETWRNYALGVKQASGMRPLHGGKARAEGCLSCHIGNVAEGKFVTHEMYAAGHPPLVGIELSKFSEDSYAEKHWLPNNDPLKKSFGVKPEDPAEFRVQLSVQGAIAAMLVQSELAAQAAKGDSKHKHIAWGDYSFFDCASCHHDLTEKSWRRKRAESGPRATGSKVYGRPPLLEWPSAAAFAVRGDALTKPLDDLRFAATETPFGNPAKVAEAARKLSAALATAAPKLSEPADWRKLLRQSLELGANNDLDFDSARQIAWLSESLAKSLGDKDPTAKAVLANYSKLSFTTDPRTLPKWIRSKDEKVKDVVPKLDAPDRLAGLNAMLDSKRKYDPAAFREWCKKALAAAPPGS